MRNICTINLMNLDSSGSLNTAAGKDELILRIIPLISQKTKYTVEITGTDGEITQGENLSAENDWVTCTVPRQCYAAAGTMSIRLVSAEETSEYVAFLVTSSPGTDKDVRVKFNLDSGQFVIDTLNDNVSELGVYDTGDWTVVKHWNDWTELHTTAKVYRASTEAYSLAVNFPDGIQIKNAQTFITPARNGWNVANYYHNNSNQDSATEPIDKTYVVFSAKSAQALTYYFEVMVCGYLAS